MNHLVLKVTHVQISVRIGRSVVRDPLRILGRSALL